MRSGKRTSSPYASALAGGLRDRRRQRERGGDDARRHARARPTPALVDVATTATHTTTAAGATTRSAVRPHGRGASSATRPSGPRRPQAAPPRRAPGAVDQPVERVAERGAGRDREQRPGETRAPQRDHRALRFDRRAERSPILRSFMPDTVFVPGMATAIGSLPHRDAGAAAALVLRCLPELPAAPQLPMRTPLEGVVAQWARCDRRRRRRAPTARSTLARRARSAGADRHRRSTRSRTAACSRSSTSRRAQPEPPRRVKVQCAGPLTLGVALVEAGVDVDVAFALGARVGARVGRVRSRSSSRRASRTPRSCCCFDEPALVRWRGGDGPIDREVATDLLSTALAARRRASRRCTCAVAAICASRSTPARGSCTSTSARSISTTPSRSSRFLDGGGWVDLGRDPDRTVRSASSRADLEGAARRVVRADAARLRSVAAAVAGARRARVRARRSRREPGRARDAARPRDRRPRARPRRGHEARRSAPEPSSRSVDCAAWPARRTSPRPATSRSASRAARRAAARADRVPQRAYFVFDEPEVADAEFDALVRELRELEARASRARHARLADATAGRPAGVDVRAGRAPRADAVARQRVLARRARSRGARGSSGSYRARSASSPSRSSTVSRSRCSTTTVASRSARRAATAGPARTSPRTCARSRRCPSS